MSDDVEVAAVDDCPRAAFVLGGLDAPEFRRDTPWAIRRMSLQELRELAFGQSEMALSLCKKMKVPTP